MMLSLTGMNCCGWKELSGLRSYNSDFVGAMRQLCTTQFLLYMKTKGNPTTTAGAVVFTSAGTWSRYAKKFAADLKENRLGEVVTLPSFTNPNTDHKILSYVWLIDVPALLRFCKTNEIYTYNSREW